MSRFCCLPNGVDHHVVTQSSGLHISVRYKVVPVRGYVVNESSRVLDDSGRLGERSDRLDAARYKTKRMFVTHSEKITLLC